MEFIYTFNKHRAEPEVGAEDYYRSLKMSLSNSIKGKKIVYLDTKFWILLRNGCLEPRNHPKERELLRIALELVGNEKCVFPISQNVFLEVLKQTDNNSLNETVKLIDTLSLGVSSISYDERAKLELLSYWYSLIGKETYDTNLLVWTKIPYCMGTFDLDIPICDESNLIRKAYMDQMWSIKLIDMIDVMRENGELRKRYDFHNAEKLNIGKFKHSSDAKSFKDMFLNEVTGLVHSYGGCLGEMMVHIYEKSTDRILDKDEREKNAKSSEKQMVNVFSNLFALSKIENELPSFSVLASLYAAVRWDAKQKFQDNDFHDFQHATTALPYCDYFFTEKRLTHMITQNLLKLDKDYSCKVMSKVGDAKVALSNLL